jgi:fatty-acyl-CoA synthase
LNIRLFPEQITYIVNHAEDEVIFIDTSIYPLIEPLLSTFTTVKHLVFMYDGKGEVPTSVPGFQVHEYESLIAAATPMQWPIVDENQWHHGQPEGRCVQPPQYIPAHNGHNDGRLRRYQ